MKFLQRLLAKPETPRTLTRFLPGPGSFEIEIIQLSIKNLDVYWNATSNEWHRKEGTHDFYERRTDVTLVSDLESRLPHAMRVEVAGKLVGHLGHSDALRLHRRLIDLGYERIRSTCDASLVGRPGYWEVKLGLDPELPGTKAAPSDSES